MRRPDRPRGYSPRPPQVLCLGEALLDRLGPCGGDPVTAAADQCSDRLGGAPANVACALARLGTPAALLGRLGRDAIGAAFARLLNERGVDTRGLQWDRHRPSRIVLVRRDGVGERQFGGFATVEVGAPAAEFADQALDAALLSAALGPLLPQARWLLVGTIPLASPSAAAALQLACRAAATAAVPMAVDVNWRPTFWDPGAAPAAAPWPAAIAVMRPVLEQATLLKCSREEAIGLFGTAEAATISAALPQRPAVVVSDGAAPLSWCIGGRSGRLPVFPAAVVDSTGAGDAFLAGLLHHLCRAAVAPQPTGGLVDPVAALRFAAACGALVCQGAGAIDPQPDPGQVRAFLARHG